MQIIWGEITDFVESTMQIGRIQASSNDIQAWDSKETKMSYLPTVYRETPPPTPQPGSNP